MLRWVAKGSLGSQWLVGWMVVGWLVARLFVCLFVRLFVCLFVLHQHLLGS